MTNLQLLLTIGIPSLLVILSWASNRSDTAALRSEMTALRVDINRDMTSLRDSIHRDMISLHERVAVVEARQS